MIHIIGLTDVLINLCNRFKLRMHSIQVDNQLPLALMPVLFRPQKVGENDNILKFSVTEQANGSLDLCVYPFIGFQVSVLLHSLINTIIIVYSFSKLHIPYECF